MEFEFFTLKMLGKGKFEATIPDEVLPYIDDVDKAELERASKIIFGVMAKALKKSIKKENEDE